MQLYLPIAEVSVNLFLLLGLGWLVGLLSGMFGVGGGFLTTPLMIFYGIPPTVAAASAASSAALLRRNIDVIRPRFATAPSTWMPWKSTP